MTYSKKKTPASVVTEARAACVAVGNRSVTASNYNNITTGDFRAITASSISQKDARKRGALRAKCGLEAYAVASEKKFNTFSKFKSIGWLEVIHHNFVVEVLAGPVSGPEQSCKRPSCSC